MSPFELHSTTGVRVGSGPHRPVRVTSMRLRGPVPFAQNHPAKSFGREERAPGPRLPAASPRLLAMLEAASPTIGAAACEQKGKPGVTLYIYIYVYNRHTTLQNTGQTYQTKVHGKERMYHIYIYIYICSRMCIQIYTNMVAPPTKKGVPSKGI